MFTVPYFTNVEVDLNWSDKLLCVNIPYRSDSPLIACNTIFCGTPDIWAQQFVLVFVLLNNKQLYLSF